MGKRGFPRREPSPLEVLEHALRLAMEVAPSAPRGRRGRPWTYPPSLYLALLLFRAFYGLTYRATEAWARTLWPDRPLPSHQSLVHFAGVHLWEELLQELHLRLRERIASRLGAEGDSPPLPDGHHRTCV
ncbi:transposase [Thermus oshimai]|jgi:hypothetical protein